MTQDKDILGGIKSTYDWCEEQRKIHKYSDISDLLVEKIDVTDNPDVRDALFSNLVSEFQMHRRDKEAEIWAVRRVAENPGDIRPLISLASHYLHYGSESDKIWDTIQLALEAALSEGKFVREVLGMKARAAIKHNQLDQLSAAVQEIVSIGFSRSQVDIGVEHDFIDRAPSGALPSDLLAQYEALYRRSREKR